jgi:hypothetical protein
MSIVVRQHPLGFGGFASTSLAAFSDSPAVDYLDFTAPFFRAI